TGGRPSARTVESQNRSAVSNSRRASSHGVTPPRGTPCRVSSVVMGSFILRTPFNRSVSLARRARRYQPILFARRKTGKAKNDARKVTQFCTVKRPSIYTEAREQLLQTLPKSVD